jgi:hypothetical protein
MEKSQAGGTDFEPPLGSHPDKTLFVSSVRTNIKNSFPSYNDFTGPGCNGRSIIPVHIITTTITIAAYQDFLSITGVCRTYLLCLGPFGVPIDDTAISCCLGTRFEVFDNVCFYSAAIEAYSSLHQV